MLARGLLEEALADALVHNDQGDLGWRHSLCFIIFEQTVFFLHDLVELFQFILNYLSAHRISNTVTVNKNVFWHRLVVITVALEGALEVITEYCARNNFLTLLWLGARLRVIFAQVGVKCCTEANRALFTLVAHVNTDEHGLLRDFLGEGHTPEVSSELGVHLSDDISEDSVIVFTNSFVCNKLRYHGGVTIDLVFQK